ncbi:DUF397 domain-containing protein [Streptomyces sp. NPDC004682]
MSNTLTASPWVKSSYSDGQGGQCLEWQPTAAQAGTVPVRDSKDPEAGTLTFGPGSWSAFISFASGQSI